MMKDLDAEVIARAIVLMHQGEYDDDIADQISREFEDHYHALTVRAWRKKANISRPPRRIQISAEQPLCRKFKDLVKLMKPAYVRRT